MTKRHITIGTRESPLAMRQTEWVRDQLKKLHPNLNIDFLGITTQGDKRLDVMMKEIGGKGLFVKELEEALLDGRADIAVHSMKDVPMELPPGLMLPVVCEREDPRDVFVSNQYKSLMQLPRGARVGTASLRRQTQLRALRADLDFVLLRGNINTRLSKLDKGEYDAIIVAAAGLKRLDFGSRITTYFSAEEILPAAGQGALGIECREGDESTLAMIAGLNDTITHACVDAERALCRHLHGGCQVPIAAYAQIHHGVLHLRGLVASVDSMRMLRVRHDGDPKLADKIGTRAAEELLQQGAEKIIKAYL